MSDEYKKKIFRDNLQGLDAYARHKKFMRDYVNFYGRNRKIAQTSTCVETKTEFDILKENHKFLRTEEEEEEELSWEQRVAKKYYDKLFKEYCIAELKYYKEGRIALRWRIEKEVITGKGQFICASTRCSNTSELKSWEVNFAYMEDGEKKNALVKIKLCPKCSDKLNYNKQHQEIKTEKKETYRDGHEERHKKRKGESFEESTSKKKKRENSPDQNIMRNERSPEGSKRQKSETMNNNPEDSPKKKVYTPIRDDPRVIKEDFDEFFTDLFV
ncbi:folate-sensitive fragile site protein Fra10Ac1-domain-containing protein [Glomus cerebriforme]|uniref:Folate-sensitive fragile site protein Fra10Ac1-domain-containing protein n=1 Tax=Glomus cerebriforme TaxID=658196 RepID=A0A397TKM5_9GLOM|nr:folate-sensitive fragile site protein Fra10Ac1-domain-containing protein [Glomus cerebriforme]